MQWHALNQIWIFPSGKILLHLSLFPFRAPAAPSKILFPMCASSFLCVPQLRLRNRPGALLFTTPVWLLLWHRCSPEWRSCWNNKHAAAFAYPDAIFLRPLFRCRAFLCASCEIRFRHYTRKIIETELRNRNGNNAGPWWVAIASICTHWLERMQIK